MDSSFEYDDEHQGPVDYIVCPDCDRPTFFCADCGREIKFRTKLREALVLLLWKVRRLHEKDVLAEAMSSMKLDTTESSEQPQQSPQVQQQSSLLEEAGEPPVNAQVGHPQDQPQLPLSLETSNPYHNPPVSTQTEGTSAYEELAMTQSHYAQPDSQPEQVLAGQYGSYDQVFAENPSNGPNTQTGDESTPSPAEQADLRSALSGRDDDDDYSDCSISSSQVATDGSEPGSRKLSRKDLKAIEKVKVPKDSTWWLEDGW